MKDRKHLYWVVGLVVITLIICGTLIWVNSHSWTVRFEMDENTKEAVKSIEWNYQCMNRSESTIDLPKGFGLYEGSMFLDHQDSLMWELDISDKIYFTESSPNITFELEVYGTGITNDINTPYIVKVDSFPCKIESYNPIKVVCREIAELTDSEGKKR